MDSAARRRAPGVWGFLPDREGTGRRPHWGFRPGSGPWATSQQPV